MVGFIKGVFGAKQTAKTEATQAPEAAPKTPKPRPQAFYLDASDAKTLGDLDYMQTAREIRRSFPKTLLGEEQRTVLEVSSIQRAQKQREQLVALQQAQTSKATPASFAALPAPVSGWTSTKADNAPKLSDPKERRRQDPNLDPFRAMARDLPKPNYRRY